MGERRRANAGERCRPQSFFIGVVAIAGECCNISFHVKNAKLCKIEKIVQKILFIALSSNYTRAFKS